mmetsp:Transcript_17811/g.45180  ORF Transcript_17811/g.45180 Transcript_17811/m.45180 type:complete len:175 (+) Transcript_17811:148-672(+)
MLFCTTSQTQICLRFQHSALLRKKRKKNSRRPLKCIRKLSAGLAGFIEELLDIDPDELKAPPATRELESLEQYRDRVRARMMVNGEEGKKVLLAVAWTTDMQSVMFVRFPEVVAADTTAQTNQEKRPLFLLAALTADNKTFSALSALLPSLGRWVFDWLLRYAIPTLLPTEALA